MTSNLRISGKTIDQSDSDIDNGQFAIAQSGWKPSNDYDDDLNNVYISSNVQYGGFYSWFAATAGQGNTAFINSASTNGTDATNSICPKGWKMPNKSARDLLFTKYTIETLQQPPANFKNNRYVESGRSGNSDSIFSVYSSPQGHTTWTRTARKQRGNEIIDFVSGGFWPHRNHGLSVRCLQDV